VTHFLQLASPPELSITFQNGATAGDQALNT
jgi:hypothetical protein